MCMYLVYFKRNIFHFIAVLHNLVIQKFHFYRYFVAVVYVVRLSGSDVQLTPAIDNGLQPKLHKGWLPIAKLKKIYKDRLDLGVTWLK